MAATQPNIVGDEPLCQGDTCDEGDGHEEVDKWPGNSSFPTQRSPQPSPREVQLDPGLCAARAVAKCIHTHPKSGHRWASSFGGVR
ncbi:hypothetical protein ZWY2020_034728 [Hordeum vulgare]|nr:hypothetical protein ZWY2020_034728 [Hordeum vulgare]